MSEIGKCLAIIPARGGSRGLPRKNVLPLNGLPLIAYSILSAKETPEIGDIVVTSDNEEILTVARGFGAETVVRPPELSGDVIMPDAALLHALEKYRSWGRPEPEWVVFLQPTSPLRFKGSISNAIRKAHSSGADSLLSVNATHGFLWRETPGGPISFSYDHRARPRRHDAPKDFIENGSLYVMRPDVLRTTKDRFGKKIALYEMSEWEGYQVDTPAEFVWLETLIKTKPWEISS